MGAWKDNCWQWLSKQFHHLRVKCLLICLFPGKGRRHMLSSQKGVAPVWTSMWVRCWLCCPEPCVQADRVENMSALQRFDSFLPMRLETNATGQTVLFLSMCNLRLSFLTIRQKVWGTPIIIRQLLWHMLLIAWWWWWPCLWLGRGANNCRSMWHRCGRRWWSRCARCCHTWSRCARCWKRSGWCGRCWTRCRCCNRCAGATLGAAGVATRGAGALDTRIRADVAFDGSAGVAGAATLGAAGAGGTDVGCTRLIGHIGRRQDRCGCWQWWGMHMTVLSVGCGLSCKYTMQITIISSCATTSLPSLDIHPCWILKAKSNTEKKKYIHLQQFQQHQPQATTTNN